METNKKVVVSGELERSLKLQGMNLDELRVEAEKLGVVLTAGTPVDEAIDAIISATVSRPETAEAGVLISLHSRQTEEESKAGTGANAARDLIVQARNVILQNEKAGKSFTLLLKNREGALYTQRVSGCKITPERMSEVLSLVAPLPDGSQTQLLKELGTDPTRFDTLLVRLRRKNGQSEGYANFIMIYSCRRQTLSEQTF